jgi:arylsulfatase A-like enzyme
MRGWALIFLLCAPAACTGRPARPPDVLLITLDTTRADKLPPYRSGQTATPTFSWLGSQGAVFANAVAPVPLTLPSHASLITGMWPSRHGIRDNASSRLPDERVTLAEVLRERGYRTAAFVSSVVLQKDRGLAQGFDLYADMPLDACGEALWRRPGNQTVDAALDWIAGQKGPSVFAWIHLFDAHRPYALDAEFARAWESPYQATIGFMDEQVGRLMQALDRHGSLDETVVIVAADHGEAFGEHGEEGHGLFLYETTVRVPLLMRGPGIEPREIPDVVRLVDVMPTVLDLVGAASPVLDGVSLTPLLSGRPLDAALDGYSESLYPERFGWSRLHALRSERYKLISAPRPELYDLQEDPMELHNRHAERSALASAIDVQFARFDGGSPDQPPPGLRRSAEALRAKVEELRYTSSVPSRSSPSPDPATVRGLAALGYVGPGRPFPRPAGARPDPKDFVSQFNELSRPRPISDRCRPSPAR